MSKRKFHIIWITKNICIKFRWWQKFWLHSKKYNIYSVWELKKSATDLTFCTISARASGFTSSLPFSSSSSTDLQRMAFFVTWTISTPISVKLYFYKSGTDTKIHLPLAQILRIIQIWLITSISHYNQVLTTAQLSLYLTIKQLQYRYHNVNVPNLLSSDDLVHEV